MKKTTFLIIVFLTLISAGCGNHTNRSNSSNSSNSSDNSESSENSENEGPVLNNIPSGRYELFSILNAVYEANPNAFDNQVKFKEFEDMLSATLNSRAIRNPDLYTEFPATFRTMFSHELEDGSFEVQFHYSLINSEYPQMENYGLIHYYIYTIMSRENYSRMITGRYIIKGKYKGLLKNSELQDRQFITIPMILSQKEDDKLFATPLGAFYYEDVSVEFIGDL